MNCSILPDDLLPVIKPSLTGATDSEKVEIQGRIAVMRAWKISNDQRPVDFRAWRVPSILMPKPRKEGGVA